jgi:hypothetical protein
MENNKDERYSHLYYSGLKMQNKCACGYDVSVRNRARHLRTQAHKAWACHPGKNDSGKT